MFGQVYAVTAANVRGRACAKEIMFATQAFCSIAQATHKLQLERMHVRNRTTLHAGTWAEVHARSSMTNVWV